MSSKIQKATIAGFDWGARTADIIAVLWLDRCKGLVPVGGYLIGSPAVNKRPLPPKAEFAWWYQYYFATPHAPPAAYREKFSGKYEHRDLTGGVGHNLPQEAPQAFAGAIIDAGGY